MSDSPTEQYLVAALELQGLALTDADRPLVLANFQRNLEIARLLTEFALADELEAAAVFRA